MQVGGEKPKIKGMWRKQEAGCVRPAITGCLLTRVLAVPLAAERSGSGVDKYVNIKNN